MKLPFRFYLLLILAILSSGCLNLEEPPPGFSISPEDKARIRRFATENGYTESMPIDSFVRYHYDIWPNETDKIDYFLTFPKQDSTPRTLVLSDVLTEIGKSLRVHYEGQHGGIYHAFIDSIKIKTDSVINFPCLDLSYSNLTHLPKEIGKLRLLWLDIGDNKGLDTLPQEITEMDSLPQPYDSLDVNSDYIDSLPNWAISWLGYHNLSGYFY